MYEKKSLRELVDELERQKNSRYDIVVPSDQLNVKVDVGTNTIFMDVPQPDDTFKQHGITEYAHDQIADKCGIPRKYYDKMREMGKHELLATNVNTWFPSKEKRLVRVLDNNVRALLSSKYRPIDNYDILFASLEEFKQLREAQNMNIEIKRADLTEQHMYLKVTSPELTDNVFYKDTKSEPVHGGIIISNSEVGAGAFNVKPFINVLVCQNGLISDKALRRIHIGRDRDVGKIEWSTETLELEDKALWSKIRDMIQTTFTPEIFHRWVDEINGVAQVEIPKPTYAVDSIIKHLDFPKGKRDELLDQFIKESPTQWGLAMAVTRLAQDEDSYEKQIDMEVKGTKILELNSKILVEEN